MPRVDYSDTLDRIQKKLQKRFPIGCRVKMTVAAGKMFPRYVGTFGTVTRYAHSRTSPFVLWDGRKTGSSYHPDLLRRSVPNGHRESPTQQEI